jgi:signal transduction histidine kinase
MDRLSVQGASGVMSQRVVPGSASPLLAQDSGSGSGSWERWGRVLADWIPYLTLTIATILSLIRTPPGQTWSESGLTIALVAVAAGWVFGMYTRAPQPRRDHPARMIVYFAGLLLIAAALMLHQPLYFIFAITAYFHAPLLRPLPLVVLAVGLMSVLIDTIVTGFPWPTIAGWTIYVPLMVIQTFTIGLGAVVGEKLSDLSEQRRQTLAQLELALEENAGLHAQLLTQAREAGVLDERQRMAREIHDTLAQGLTGIITQLEAAEQARERQEDRQRHLDNAARLARESLSEARRSVQASRPEPLESAALPDALAEVAQQWSAINGVPVAFTTTGDPLPLHPEVEVALLRTAQEALANVAKHARASRAGLTLSYMGDVVMLDVRDDGVGFAVPSETNRAGGAGADRGAGFGLIAMRQRVSRVAGTLVVESEPGGGTAISARVPAIVAQPPGHLGGPGSGPGKTPKEAPQP